MSDARAYIIRTSQCRALGPLIQLSGALKYIYQHKTVALLVFGNTAWILWTLAYFTENLSMNKNRRVNGEANK